MSLRKTCGQPWGAFVIELTPCMLPGNDEVLCSRTHLLTASLLTPPPHACMLIWLWKQLTQWWWLPLPENTRRTVWSLWRSKCATAKMFVVWKLALHISAIWHPMNSMSLCLFVPMSKVLERSVFSACFWACLIWLMPKGTQTPPSRCWKRTWTPYEKTRIRSTGT